MIILGNLSVKICVISLCGDNVWIKTVFSVLSVALWFNLLYNHLT